MNSVLICKLEIKFSQFTCEFSATQCTSSLQSKRTFGLRDAIKPWGIPVLCKLFDNKLNTLLSDEILESLFVTEKN